MRRFNEFNLHRQILAVVGTLPIFGWVASSVMYPMTTQARGTAVIEEREGYSLTSLNPCITAEIAMQAASHSEALLRGKEQLNGYTEGGNSRLKEVVTLTPTMAKKLSAKEAEDQDPLILLTDRFNKDPTQGLYLISYVLGAAYSRSYLGKPNNPYIKLREKDREVVATRKFWGYPTPGKLKKEEAELKRLLDRDGFEFSEPVVAEFSPPWVFYFLRQNELMVHIQRKQL